jgi:integrase
LRVSEAVRMRRQDLNLKRAWVWIRRPQKWPVCATSDCRR